MIDLAIQIDKIAIGGNKVQRQWTTQEDGSLIWRKRLDVMWKIELQNSWPKPTAAHRPLRSIEGRPFLAYDNSVTLDDFVMLRDVYVYCHIKTGLTFTARQINRHIFRNKSTWPVRHGEETRMNPARWIRKYNRVEDSKAFNVIRGALHVAA